jgi:hypothetical protein
MPEALVIMDAPSPGAEVDAAHDAQEDEGEGEDEEQADDEEQEDEDEADEDETEDVTPK